MILVWLRKSYGRGGLTASSSGIFTSGVFCVSDCFKRKLVHWMLLSGVGVVPSDTSWDNTKFLMTDYQVIGTLSKIHGVCTIISQNEALTMLLR